MVQVLCLIEVFILAHYGPPSTETPTTTIVRCHTNSWIYLTSTYLLLVTFETNDNYSIRFEISYNSSTIRFSSIRNEANTICTALVMTCWQCARTDWWYLCTGKAVVSMPVGGPAMMNNYMIAQPPGFQLAAFVSAAMLPLFCCYMITLCIWVTCKWHCNICQKKFRK